MKTFLRFVARALPLIALVGIVMPESAFGISPQSSRTNDRSRVIYEAPEGGPTSGSLSTQSNQVWSTAPWMITGGAGAFPTGGGVATILEQINTIIGTPPAVPIITI